MEPTEREEVVAGSFQSVVEAELQKPKHSLAREKEVGSRAHDQTLRGYRVGSGRWQWPRHNRPLPLLAMQTISK
jgi:hypothetical protein